MSAQLQDVLYDWVGNSLICNCYHQGSCGVLTEVGNDFLHMSLEAGGLLQPVLFSKFGRLLNFSTDTRILMKPGGSLWCRAWKSS